MFVCVVFPKRNTFLMHQTRNCCLISLWLVIQVFYSQRPLITIAIKITFLVLSAAWIMDKGSTTTKFNR